MFGVFGLTVAFGIAFIINIELLSILCKLDLADITISNALLGPRPTTETSSF